MPRPASPTHTLLGPSSTGPTFAATEAARSLAMILRRRMSFDANFKVGYTKYVFQLSVFHAVDNK